MAETLFFVGLLNLCLVMEIKVYRIENSNQMIGTVQKIPFFAFLWVYQKNISKVIGNLSISWFEGDFSHKTC
jgi:hypothetical protein